MKSLTSKLVWGLTVLLLLSATSVAFAVRGTAKVSNTVHNLSVSGPGWSLYRTNETEICIFCHTPHGGDNTGPLWNRNVPGAASFTLYDSSTISAAVAGVTTINPESLLCLACHDGGLSVNHLLNYSTVDPILNAGTGSAITTIVGTPGANPRIGGNPASPAAIGQLGDDHPISFSYDAVLTEYGGKGGLHTVAAAETTGVQFFGGTNRVECSSCHDPHVDYEVSSPDYFPFLI
ncbi:MAG: hypothetical protein IBX47_13110, partial [Desulfuromonadales bacterium]|nr:hypothetical protein [Desulfuromonadales bacterium]